METKQKKKKKKSGVLCLNKNTNVGQGCISFVCEIKWTSMLYWIDLCVEMWYVINKLPFNICGSEFRAVTMPPLNS